MTVYNIIIIIIIEMKRGTIPSLDSSVGIDWTARILFSAEARGFPLLYCVKTSSGAHPASYPVGTRGSISRGKEAGP
jgi:hypothetical protein